MYSYEERKRAVEEYIKHGYCAQATVRDLGYPSHTAIVQWYKEFKETGQLREK